MQFHAFVRAGCGIVAVALLVAGGCRSTSTDRMRVIEAKKADAERRADDLTNKNALLRAEKLAADAEAEIARAGIRAAEARLDMVRSEIADHETAPDVDLSKLRQMGGVKVRTLEDGGSAIVLASDVTFRAGKADLSKRAISALQRLARALKDSRGIRSVRVEGHTDTDPIKRSGWKNNTELSTARADSVRRFLVAAGVSETILTVEGLGATQPVASNGTAAGKAQNRRVEIILQSR